MEKTLSLIKPDGVRKSVIGEVIQRFEKNGLNIVAMRMMHLSKKQAEGFYAVHKDKPFFQSLTDFMSSGPMIALILKGDNAITRNRELMGATDYQKADEGTIRKDFASSIEQNIVHGSDSPETAAYEISYFFSDLDIVE